MQARSKTAIIILCALLFASGCTYRTLYIDPTQAGTGRYSTFPSGPGWDIWPPPYLVMVMTTAQYEVVRYTHERDDDGLIPDDSSPTGYRLLPGDLGRYVDRTSDTIRGAGIVLRQDGNDHLILTCHHVIEFPERITYEIESDETETGDLLIGEGERKQQQVFVGRPRLGQVRATTIASSPADDLALVRANLKRFEGTVSPALIPIGDGNALRGGDGLYLLGAPSGNFQVTWGVATPGSESLFFADTATPPGYSGGPVLAVARESGQLELIGVITGSAGSMLRIWDFDDAIVPGYRMSEVDPAHVSAREIKTFDYGITHCISESRIRALLRKSGFDAAQDLPAMRIEGFRINDNRMER